jgi:hypothetical protein
VSDARAARRRDERALAKIQDTGVAQRVTAGRGEMPPKVPGRHRWIMLTTYAVPDRFVEEVVRGVQHSDVHFDNENRIDTHFGCYDCEQVLTPSSAVSACAAPAAP